MPGKNSGQFRQKMLMIQKYKCHLLWPILLSFVYSLFGIALPVILDYMIDAMTKNAIRVQLVFLSELYLGVALLWVVSNILKTYFGNRSAWRITDDLRLGMMLHNIVMGHSFYNQYSAGDVLEHMENDIETIESFIINTFIPILTSLFTILGIFVYFWITQMVFGVFFLLITLIIFAVIYHAQQQSQETIEEERVYSTRLTSFLSEVFMLRKEINVMHGKAGVIQKSDEIMLNLKEKKVRKQQYLYHVWTLTLLMIAIANTTAIFISGKLYFDGALTLGTVYLAYAFSTMLKDPLEHMQYHLQNFKTAQISYLRYKKMMEYKDGIEIGEQPFPAVLTTLSIQNVSHSYADCDTSGEIPSADCPQETNHLALREVSFTIHSGEKVGIFGASGSGKSTICKLIGKLYVLQAGDIFFNEVSIREISTSSLRSAVAYLTASDQVFSATLKDNLDMFSQSDSQTMADTIDQYGLRAFLNISIDEDLQKKLAEQITADQLSHGQRQLISLSRLFFQSKKLIIFDEAAANVDAAIENAFFSLLEKAMRGHMSIVVTHHTERLGTCQNVIEFVEGKARML